MIPTATEKRFHIATNSEHLAGESVGLAIEIVRFSSLLSPLNGDVSIGFDAQIDVLTDSFGRGHRDDTFGEEGAGGEERAEEDEEPDA